MMACLKRKNLSREDGGDLGFNTYLVEDATFTSVAGTVMESGEQRTRSMR
jgi:hypothetical protein